MVTSSDVGMTGSQNSGPYCPILGPDYAREKGPKTALFQVLIMHEKRVISVAIVAYDSC